MALSVQSLSAKSRNSLVDNTVVLARNLSLRVALTVDVFDHFAHRTRSRPMASSPSFLPSAQVTADGQPRFHLPVDAAHPAWAAAAAEEEAGGVSAEVRAFLDAQLGNGDVLVDLSPGFGFVALSATTAPNGMPTVFVCGLTEERMQALQDAAIDVGGWLDELPAASLPELASSVEARLEPEGRVFVHADAARLADVGAWLKPVIDAENVLAICISDAATTEAWPDVVTALDAMGFTACCIVEQDGELMVMPLDEAPTTPVIAMPTVLVGSDPTEDSA